MSSSIFATYWAQLADELKVCILNHALPNSETFSGEAFSKERRCSTGRSDSISQFEMNVLPLLACLPIAGLAKEAFYRNNTFRVSNWSMSGRLLLPRPTVNMHVRHIKLVMQFSSRALGALRALTRFPSLARVDIEINGIRGDADCRTIYKRLNTMDDLCIHTRALHVVFRYKQEQDLYRFGGKLLESKKLAPKLDVLLFQKLRAVWEGWTVKESTEKIISFLEGDDRRQTEPIAVEEWPEEDFEGWLVHTRETKRDMWV